MQHATTPRRRQLIKAALKQLGIERFALSIHDRSFPSLPREDSGRGTPYSQGAQQFLQFVRDLGFDTIQLGPQGLTSRSDPSPYGSSVFARDPLLLSPATLHTVEGAGIYVAANDAEELHALAGSYATPQRVDYDRAWSYGDALLHKATDRLRSLPPAEREGFEAFRRARLDTRIDWLKRDTLYEILSARYRTDDWEQWTPPRAHPVDAHMFTRGWRDDATVTERIASLLSDGNDTAERFQLGQYLTYLQHRDFKDRASRMGLQIFGDVQIGYSHRDRWAWGPLFLEGYLLGAPPSRSNREGQPWGYPVLDPRLMASDASAGDTGIAHGFFEERFDGLLDEYHGLRIDHPHGLVCPWVYRDDDPDAFHAVQNGARLNCAPNLPDHPALAAFALVSPQQLDSSGATTRYDDEYVRELTPGQVEKFDAHIETILTHAAQRGVPQSAILCEVLSTWPNPLKAVMKQHGLGRFCVTQKADPNDPTDVYRSENTSANDWIMVGTHDTPPLWHVVDTHDQAWRRNRAGLLAQHLSTSPRERQELQDLYTVDVDAFCQGMFTELFLAPASNISVFFADLLGTKETYNQPGTIGSHNWSMRVPREYETLYKKRCAEGKAFDVAGCIARALRVNAGDTEESDATALAAQLEQVN